LPADRGGAARQAPDEEFTMRPPARLAMRRICALLALALPFGLPPLARAEEPVRVVSSTDGLWSGLLPPAVYEHTAILDPRRDRMIVYGGIQQTSGEFGDLWAMSLAEPVTWTRIWTEGTPPPPRYGHSAILDPHRDRMLVFGGDDLDTRVWALSLADPPTWTEISPAGTPPPGRWDHSAVYDSKRDAMVVYAGRTSASFDAWLGDAWSLSLGGALAWTPIVPTGPAPQPRYGHAAAYDPVLDRMVVLGGQHTYEDGDPVDTWSLVLGDSPEWVPGVPLSDSYGVRVNSTLVWDPVRARMITLGGEDDFGVPTGYAGCLAADDVSWRALDCRELPAPRAQHTLVYDPDRDQVVLFGGREYSERTDFYSDAFALPLATAPAHWRRLSPPRRSGHAAVLDGPRRRAGSSGAGARRRPGPSRSTAGRRGARWRRPERLPPSVPR
jgi:hypothetical protein